MCYVVFLLCIVSRSFSVFGGFKSNILIKAFWHVEYNFGSSTFFFFERASQLKPGEV